MAVVRVHKRDNPYVQLERDTLRRTDISFKARGLWAMCMSYPDDWEFNLTHLEGMSETDGKHALRSAFKELESAGLASLEDVRNDDGTLSGKRWLIYEKANLNPSSDRHEENPDVGENRRSENPDVGKTEHNVVKNKEDVFYRRERDEAPAREQGESTTQQKEESQQAPPQREVPDEEDVPAEVAAVPLPHHAPSYREVVQQAELAGLPESEAKKFYLYYAGDDFENRHGRPLNWQAKLGRWRMRWKSGEFQSDTEKKKRANGISQMW